MMETTRLSGYPHQNGEGTARNDWYYVHSSNLFQQMYTLDCKREEKTVRNSDICHTVVLILT